MSNMNEKLEELFAFYALGTLTASERAQVEAYAASNPEAKARLDEMIRTASALPHEVSPMNPSAALKERLMERVKADARTRYAPARQPLPANREHAPRPHGARLAYAIAVLSLAAAVGIGLWGLSLYNEVARLRTAVAVLEQEVQSQRTVLAQLTSPEAKTFAITGTEHQPQAQGQLIADSKTGSAVLVVTGLKPLPAGNIYEFWLIKDSAAVPAGLFKVDQQGQGLLQVTQTLASNSFNAIGVSIEPAGGSQQPTGDIVMLGKLSD